MSGFGDFDPGPDTHDDAPADPEAVARILIVELRARVPARSGTQPSFRTWDEHTAAERAGWIAALGVVLARLRDEEVT